MRNLANLSKCTVFLVFLSLAACADGEQAPPVEALPTLAEPRWVVQNSGTASRLQAISAVDARVVWASGVGGAYARTTDGGATWQAGVVPGADSLQFRDVHAVDAQTAYLLSSGTGAGSRIYKTTDAGASWTLQFTNPEPEGFFDCFDFWDARRGVAMGDEVDGRLTVIRTEDGGATWAFVPPDGLPPALDGEGAFAASGTCLIAGEGGRGWIGTGASAVAARVFRTVDYGRTWTVHDTPIVSNTNTSGIFSLAFRDTLHGVALGGDFSKPQENFRNVAATSDGGRTWTMVGATRLTGSAFGAAYVPGTATPTLVAVAPTGSDYSIDEGRTWTRIDTLDYWSTTFVSPEAGWAVGLGGRIARLVNAVGQGQPGQ